MNETPKRRGRPRKVVEEPQYRKVEYIDVSQRTQEAITEWATSEEAVEQPNGNNRPTCWASFEATINIGNYQNEKVSIGLAGVPIDATEEELNALLEGGKATINMVIEKLGHKMADQIEALGGFRF